jgi:hypothetical protein
MGLFDSIFKSDEIIYEKKESIIEFILKDKFTTLVTNAINSK